MGEESKSLDELLNQLPRESWAEVRDFIESLLRKQGSRPARQRKEKEKEKETFAVGERVEQLCITCGEERSQIVFSVTKKGRIIRVSCPVCGSRVPYTSGANARSSPERGVTYSKKAIGHLPPAGPKSPVRLRQRWAGALSEYRHTFSALTLQEKSLEWRGD